METLELQVKNVDEAKTAAAAQLGVTPDRINLTVLDESPGLFGKKKLKVQVELIEEGSAKPSKGAKPAKAEKVEKPSKAAPVAAVEKEAKPEKPAKAEKPAKEAKPERAPRAAKAKATEEAPATEEGGDDAREAVEATQADADALIDMIQEVLEIADIEATVTVRELQGRYVNLELDGKDVAHLVGKSGEVLNSFQYLMNLMASKRFDNGVRITLDGNNFRRRREEVLRNLATNVANEVVKRGEEAVFDALPAFERRIVHKVLSEIPGVQTYSEGEEPNRRVVVAPAN